MKLTYAEFCAGYGGLGLAVEEVFGAELKWYSEFDAAPSAIMAHHWPGVPNLGDMTAIDWDAVEPVDILSGGTPCQDLSAAGRRKGMTEGTRSNLWVHMREAIATIKPTYVVWENVRGAYSANASSDLEQCPGCVGNPSDGRVFLRALGRVLGDLSDLGYDCQWRGLRAADVGAPHGRFRVFVLATYTSGERRTEGDLSARFGATGVDGPAIPHEPDTGHIRPEPTADADRLGHERARDSRDGGLGLANHGLSTPNTCSPAVRQHPGESSAEEAGTNSGNGSGDPHGERATGERRTLTPDTDSRNDDGRLGDAQWSPERREAAARGGKRTDGFYSRKARKARYESRDLGALKGLYDPNFANWGEYGPAIHRWENTIGRPAPSPTDPTGRNGGHRLSPRFTEWMMGLPDGWVTAPEIGLTRNEQLKACGNGVVPQQAIAALSDMLAYAQNTECAA